MRRFMHLLLHWSPLLLVLLMAGVGFLSSCEMRNVLSQEEYDNLHKAAFGIQIDWSELKEKPTGMSVYIYEVDGPRRYHFKTNNVDYFRIDTLPEADYQILVFNQSEEEFSHLEFENMNEYLDATVRVRPDTTADELNWETRSFLGFNNSGMLHPGSFAVASVPSARFDLTRGYNNSGMLHPGNMIGEMNINVHVMGLSNAARVEGTISGMSAGRTMATAAIIPQSMTQNLPDWDINMADNDSTPGSVHITFGTFGTMHQATRGLDTRVGNTANGETSTTGSESMLEDEYSNIVTVIFHMVDGSVQTFSFDATDAIEEVEDPNQEETDIGGGSGNYVMNLELEVGTEIVPAVTLEPVYTDGIHPTVQNWGDTIVHNITF